ncbi:hypothetical protein AVEN_81819-1, partial [Araneus ventricosus]
AKVRGPGLAAARSFHTYPCKTLFPTIRLTLLGSDFHVRNNIISAKSTDEFMIKFRHAKLSQHPLVIVPADVLAPMV